ncbi:hypothetical protein A1O1_05719 [Capronia coronata CBS 617.96]|uniref:EKC/KEOPS complex subunit GON7 n=1 Tax=Capronia coronata CBS 617.96 TaxID=1182541 RepID=W9Y6Y0_9EURO|nr:uncharacterized protein A1O1_05719 [Capronia coronata CBS 617.96]EXJ85355.1 hypothetical protein A1O1_05719 [Capronia coronata CBS 617.96]
MTNRTERMSATLSATYHSPTGDRTFCHSIAVPQSDEGQTPDTQAKTEYLSCLRASTKALQEEVNGFLTDKMEEDNKSGERDSKISISKRQPDDEVEEENYGDEVAEDES